VPIRLVGQPVGVVDGGVMDYQTREVEVECLALEAPDHLDVDVSGLHIGQGIHVGQLQAPANVTIVSDPERPVVAVHAPRAVKEEVPAEAPPEGAEAAEAAGPEVITEKKPKEEEKEPEKKKGKEKEK
jgi:large subunit ribosomal protein L25